MAVICAKCGEELLGAVNRCWRCGQHAVSTPDAAAAPPVRRSPVALRLPEPPRVEAEADFIITDDGADDRAANATADAGGNAEDDGDSEIATDPATEAAPDVTFGDAERTSTIPTGFAALTGGLKAFGWKSWLALASIVMGVISIGLGWLTPWMVLVAGAGLACGIVGVTSRRKLLAIVGLLLCLIGITVSSVRLAYDTFMFLQGEAVSPTEPLGDDEFYDPFDAAEPLE